MVVLEAWPLGETQIEGSAERRKLESLKGQALRPCILVRRE